MPNGEKYEFSELFHIVNSVPDDDINNFLVDLESWLRMSFSLRKIKNIMGENSVQLSKTFKWINDGKNDVNITVKVQKNDAV